ncbi:MAG: ribonuclease HII [Thermoanaerobaculaceae bacterium]
MVHSRGPVTAAAVILDPAHPIAGLDDSKRLTQRQRERLAGVIRHHALAWTVAHRSPAEIDQVNILEATRSAMRQSACALGVSPGMVVSDAVGLPGLPFPWLAEPRADARYCCVAAASILAKVSRDRLMRRLATRFDGLRPGPRTSGTGRRCTSRRWPEKGRAACTDGRLPRSVC